MASVSDVIRSRLGHGLPRAIREVGNAWAAESAKEAPRGLSGTLIRSIRFEPNADGGDLVMVFYGQVVAHSTPMLSPSRRAVSARARYSRRVGHVPTHPNPFYVRAWHSRAVADAKAHFPRVAFEME